MSIFKIRHKIEGTFSTGGTRPYFNKTGKIFKTLTSVRLHMKQFNRNWEHEKDYLDSIEVVEYEVIEKSILDINSII